MSHSQESFMFTVGKLDAGMAILLGERAHLIEFPSLLLPPGATTGSIVNISVTQNIKEEKKRDAEFWNLQNDILSIYGTTSPEHPKLEVRNVTQTSVTLEWPQLQLATAKLRSLDIYRNRQRLAAIPSPLTNTSTKLSGLQLDTEYTFQLILRTTAGTFPSNLLRLRTHMMTDTSGISVCFGNVQDAVLLENAKMALREMGAKWSDKIQIDTTHFVCTTPAATPDGSQATGGITTAPGVEYQKALQLSIPVVQPHWILACHTEKKMMPIHSYYLGKEIGSKTSFSRHQSMSQANLSSPSRDSVSPTKHAVSRQSMPPQQRPTPTSPTSSFVHQSAKRGTPESPAFAPMPEEQGEESFEGQQHEVRRPTHVRTGTMSKNFRFPSSAPHEAGSLPANPLPPASASPPKDDAPTPAPLVAPAPAQAVDVEDAGLAAVGVVGPSSVEVPPPPPVDKEPMSSQSVDDEVGETEEISLN
ncbi:hypothetical protein BKA93DRAFT_741014 [Sparassis latifolia]|uniref:Chitin biosynthesis protein n=1 Tax=Sparassis crispa TaxID=139825 RepID=A0A401H717_9APHY|nr:Chitin biosynthesis protein [Sparassis crispa]GBE90214.1 Chitin biosynthesis protein [Sparassis crispa]